MSDHHKIQCLEYDVSRLKAQVRSLQSRIEDRTMMLGRIEVLERISIEEIKRQNQIRDFMQNLLKTTERNFLRVAREIENMEPERTTT